MDLLHACAISKFLAEPPKVPVMLGTFQHHVVLVRIVCIPRTEYLVLAKIILLVNLLCFLPSIIEQEHLQ